MKKIHNWTAGLIGLLCLQTTHAVDLDAGDYDYAPSGTNLAMLYYQHASRDEQYVGSSKVSNQVELKSDIGIARYVHYMDVAGIHIAPQILIPFGRLDAGKDISILGKANGIGDIILANTFFLYHDANSKSTFGITPYLYLPTGQYSKNNALNIGENRVKLALQGAYTTQLIDRVNWDIAGDFTLYGKNEDVVGDDVADLAAQVLELVAGPHDVVQQVPDLGLQEVLLQLAAVVDLRLQHELVVVEG